MVIIGGSRGMPPWTLALSDVYSVVIFGRVCYAQVFVNC